MWIKDSEGGFVHSTHVQRLAIVTTNDEFTGPNGSELVAVHRVVAEIGAGDVTLEKFSSADFDSEEIAQQAAERFLKKLAK
jgi:hypothetical protein